MLIKISQEKMLKLGEVVFAAFDNARKSCGLTGTELVSEGLIPYRQKLYVVKAGKCKDFDYYSAIFRHCISKLPSDKRQYYKSQFLDALLE